MPNAKMKIPEHIKSELCSMAQVSDYKLAIANIIRNLDNLAADILRKMRTYDNQLFLNEYAKVEVTPLGLQFVIEWFDPDTEMLIIPYRERHEMNDGRIVYRLGEFELEIIRRIRDASKPLKWKGHECQISMSPYYVWHLMQKYAIEPGRTFMVFHTSAGLEPPEETTIEVRRLGCSFGFPKTFYDEQLTELVNRVCHDFERKVTAGEAQETR